MTKRLLILFACCAVLKGVLWFLPDASVLAAFCRIPAEVAAFHYGAPLDATNLSFTAHGVTLAVTRACAATDFFTLVASTLVTARILRKGWIARNTLDFLLAWLITLVVNSLRIIALVPVDALFPKDHAPIIHLLAGVAFFLPAFVFIWYRSFKELKS